MHDHLDQFSSFEFILYSIENIQRHLQKEKFILSKRKHLKFQWVRIFHKNNESKI